MVPTEFGAKPVALPLITRIGDRLGPGETTPERHRAAIVLMGLGAIGCSLGGLFVRHLEEADAWQFNAYRGLVGGVILLGVLAARHRARTIDAFRRLSAATWVAALCLGLAAICYILSLEHTTVANTHFVLSATPFLTAALAWLFLGERLRASTVAATAAALVGIALMLGDGLVTGNVAGDLFALGTVALFSTFGVIMRSQRRFDMLPVIVVSSFVTMAAGVAGAAGDVLVSAHDIALGVAWGAIVGTCGDWFFVIAVRHLAAAETTLLMMMVPSVLGPLWVWLLLREVPSAATLIGGALVLCAVSAWALRDLLGSRVGDLARRAGPPSRRS